VISVLVADDQALVRRGFRMILEIEGDLEVVGEAADGEEAVALSLELQPDIVLMDVRMPGMSGIQAGRRILDAGTTRLLVFLSCDLVEVPEDLAGVPGIVVLRKEQLRPAILRRVWEGAEPRGSRTAERAV